MVHILDPRSCFTECLKGCTQVAAQTYSSGMEFLSFDPSKMIHIDFNILNSLYPG